MTAAPPPTRRHAWPWVVGVLVVLGLVVAAWFLGEWVARDLVTKTIREQAVTRLALPADQDVDVEVTGAVIPQLIKGTLDEVHVSSRDVTVGAFTGDVSADLHGVSIRDPGAMRSGSVTVGLDEAQLRALMSTVDGFPSDTLGIAAPNVTATVELSVFGARIPIGVALAPSAADGGIVLHPAALQLAGATIGADDLRARFGSVAQAALRDWDVCVASSLPAGVELRTVAVTGDRLVATFAVDGRIGKDAALREKGTCA
ncbi:MAG: DUF2993 domain-containing protein [Microbacterium sp.]|uniref:LmeA family phospholipid-binding protein n=1 Tax=Microbacterium sp. TaxID=51671 RepID=UPI001AD404CB|nr:DUF2993 domain-containing protein [Microbacterium sp.]MBN9154318.1 DUF2993 domain-containing protein [Microbacterium sp.]MBN9175258.1 DUF2993 domain-containing protein [Microbacterium sp.]